MMKEKSRVKSVGGPISTRQGTTTTGGTSVVNPLACSVRSVHIAVKLAVLLRLTWRFVTVVNNWYCLHCVIINILVCILNTVAGPMVISKLSFYFNTVVNCEQFIFEPPFWCNIQCINNRHCKTSRALNINLTHAPTYFPNWYSSSLICCTYYQLLLTS